MGKRRKQQPQSGFKTPTPATGTKMEVPVTANTTLGGTLPFVDPSPGSIPDPPKKKPPVKKSAKFICNICKGKKTEEKRSDTQKGTKRSYCWCSDCHRNFIHIHKK